GQYAAVNGDAQQVSASLYKIWVLCELYHQVQEGTLSLDDDAVASADDVNYGVSLGEARFSEGDSLTLRQAAVLMITLSDNTAAEMLVRTLGPDNIQNFMRQNGFTHSVLDWSGVGDNLTTP